MYAQNSLLKHTICNAELYLSAQLTSRRMFCVLYYVLFVSSLFSVKSLTKAHSLINEEDEEGEGPVTSRLCRRRDSSQSGLDFVWTTLNDAPRSVATRSYERPHFTAAPPSRQSNNTLCW